jgi:hypothetical protein
MAICNSTQLIASSECIGDSLVKINNNFTNLDSDVCSLLTYIRTLSASSFYTETEAVIGPTETTRGYIGADTNATGSTYQWYYIQQIADFRWEKANNTSVLLRMESKNLSQLNTWNVWGEAGFFPYKPTGKVASTKFTVFQRQLDATYSYDHMWYTMHVDWEKKTALLTGLMSVPNYNSLNSVFIKKWNFSNGAEQSIKYDSNLNVTGTDQRGERSVDWPAYSGWYGHDNDLIVQVHPTLGIQKIPVWTVAWYYGGPAHLPESSQVSIFIENTFRP